MTVQPPLTPCVLCGRDDCTAVEATEVADIIASEQDDD